MTYAEALADLMPQITAMTRPTRSYGPVPLSELPSVKAAKAAFIAKGYTHKQPTPYIRERHSEIYMPESGTYECTCGHSACCELFQSRRDDEEMLP